VSNKSVCLIQNPLIIGHITRIRDNSNCANESNQCLLGGLHRSNLYVSGQIILHKHFCLKKNALLFSEFLKSGPCRNKILLPTLTSHIFLKSWYKKELFLNFSLSFIRFRNCQKDCNKYFNPVIIVKKVTQSL
jgi:hypothetical protein